MLIIFGGAIDCKILLPRTVHSKRKTGDCLIRAIACAFDYTWEDTSDLLYEIARSNGCEMSCLDCYSALFMLMDLQEIEVPFDITVGELAQLYPNDTIIVRTVGHLTCAKYGTVYDIWDCRDEIVDRAWLV